MDKSNYELCVANRRALCVPGYESFADVGLDGPWTTPYHIAAAAPDGPLLLTYNYLDAPSARRHRDELLMHGFLASMPFNRVLDLALMLSGRQRNQIYVTHAFHLLPKTRSQSITATAIDVSFDAVGSLECRDRRVVALGDAAARVCRRHAIPHIPVPHPSARGLTHQSKAEVLAACLR